MSETRGDKCSSPVCASSISNLFVPELRDVAQEGFKEFRPAPASLHSLGSDVIYLSSCTGQMTVLGKMIHVIEHVTFEHGTFGSSINFHQATLNTQEVSC